MAITISEGPDNGEYADFAGEPISITFSASTDSTREVPAEEEPEIPPEEPIEGETEEPEIPPEEDAEPTTETEEAVMTSTEIQLSIDLPDGELAGISLTSGIDSCSMKGKFVMEKLFSETKMKYISNGSTDRSEDPTSIESITDFDALPTNVTVISLLGDPKNEIKGTITVTAKNSFDESLVLEKEYRILNNYNKLQEYLDKVY